MVFLPNLFGPPGKENTKSATNRALGGWNRGSIAGHAPLGQAGRMDITQAAKVAERVSWVMICVNIIAKSAAQAEIVLRDHYGEGEVKENSRLYQLLNRRPNKYETAFQFRFRLSTILLLSRRGAFVEVVHDKGGMPCELHILPPETTKIIPDPDSYTLGFQVTRADGRVEFLCSDRVVWVMHTPHPTDPYSQWTPLMAAGIAADISYLIKQFNRNTLANDGLPGVIVSVPPDVSVESADEIKAKMSGGPLKAGEVLVLQSDVKLTDMGGRHDMSWRDLADLSKEEIAAAFGIPVPMMESNFQASTYMNASAELSVFNQFTLSSHCEAITNGLDRLAVECGGDGDDMLVVNWSKNETLQAIEQAYTEGRAGLVVKGVESLNDFRAAVKRDPIGHPLADCFWIHDVPVAKDPKDQDALLELWEKMQPKGAAAGVQSGEGALF